MVNKTMKQLSDELLDYLKNRGISANGQNNYRYILNVMTKYCTHIQKSAACMHFVTLMSSPRQKNIYFFLSPRSSFLDRDFAASRFCSAAKKRMKSLLFFRQHTPKSCAAFSAIKRNPHNQSLSLICELPNCPLS